MNEAEIYTSKTWTCPECGQEVLPIDAQPFGWVRQPFCPRCQGDEKEAMLDRSWLHQAQRNRWFGDSGLSPDYTFENHKGTGKAAAIKYARSLLSGARHWLWLYGPPGSGRLHLAQAIGRMLIDESVEDPRPRFIDWACLTDVMKDTWAENPQHADYPTILAEARSAGLLILFNVDGGPKREWALQKLVNIATHRSRLNKPILYVASMPFDGKGETLWSGMMRGIPDTTTALMLLSGWETVLKKQLAGNVYTGAKR